MTSLAGCTLTMAAVCSGSRGWNLGGGHEGWQRKKGRRARKWQHTKFNFKSAFIFHIVCWFLSLTSALSIWDPLFVHYVYIFFSHFSSPSPHSYPLGAHIFSYFSLLSHPSRKIVYLAQLSTPSLPTPTRQPHTCTHSHVDYPSSTKQPPPQPNLPPAKGFFVRCPSTFLAPFSFWRTTTARGAGW